ncbi:MAG TPA: ABC transporter substrate-binding protein, partial [Stellaceae bacterium]|nr:ABC transporter substrate-binding protein [Stellaceae bacterium]
MPRIVALALILLSLATPSRASAIVDDSGRRVELPDKVARVLPAGPPAAAFLYAVAPQSLLGWPHEPAGGDRGYIAEPFASLPQTGTITGRANEVDAQTMAQLHPDLILDLGTVSRRYQELAESTQAKTGVPYVLLDGKIAALPATLRKLGRILGAEPRGEELASYAERTLAEVQARAAAIPAELRYRVYYGRGKDGLTTAGTGSIGAEFIEVLGLVNAAPAGERQMYEATPEQLAAWKPDVVVILGTEAAALFAKDPRWQDLPAVREKRVFGSPTLPFGWVDGPPSPSRLLALRWLGHALYPDQFPEDIRAATRDF